LETRAVPAPVEEVAEETSFKGHGTILLVDDEEPIRELGSLILESMGFKVLTAADGVEALEVFRKQKNEIICVLLDLTMPRMDGDETLQQLRLIDAKIPVLISSGYNEQEVVQRFTGKDTSGFIQKPYTISNLTGKLKEVLKIK
jgi:CheY-like chemotaxis protein